MMKWSMAGKVARRHLPSEPMLRDVLEAAVKLEYVIAARSVVALLPDDRWHFFEFEDFPDGLASARAYAKETGRDLIVNGGVGGGSMLAAMASYRRKHRS
jgi:hypothetical protein